MPDQEKPSNIPASELFVLATSVARIEEQTKHTASEVATIRQNMVTKAEIRPTQMIAFGLVALVMIAVITAVLAQVLKGG